MGSGICKLAAPPHITGRRTFATVALRTPYLPTFFRIGLAAVLLAAGGLKTYSLITNPLASDPIFGSPIILAAIALVETTVGFWILWGGWFRACTIAARALLVVFAAISFYLGAFRQASSCGCLGDIAVNPWFAFAFDMAALVFLFLAARRLEFPQQITLESLFGRIFGLVAGCALFLGFAFTLLSWLNGSVYEGLVKLRGEKVTISPAVTDLGEGIRGETRTFTVTLRNHSDSPIRVAGGTSNCSCVAIRNLPVIIPSHEELPIEVIVSYAGREGAFEKRFLFYLEDQSQALAVARLKGRLLGTE